MQTGIKPLPEPLDPRVTGFKMSSNNSSDDLFMFLAKRLSREDGVDPGTSYRIEISLRLATESPWDLGGIGGPPGAGVHVKVGVIGREPKVSPDDHGHFRLNADIGAQANSGQDLSVAGDLSNGLNSTYENRGVIWRLVRRNHIHPNLVRSNAEGKLWAIVGTDSGFEGITTVYYSSIVVRLTPEQRPDAP